MFVGTFLYGIGFVGNFFVAKSIDSGLNGPVWRALLINLVAIVIFGVQHSAMARPAFKRVWTKIVPKHVERSTYVLFSNLALILLYYLWQPMGGMVWQVESQIGTIVLYSIFGLGWTLVMVSTFLINHFELFGIRQVYLNLIGKEYTPLEFATKGPYKYVRHPLYLGFLLAFWATPTMTIVHLFLAVVSAAYILVAVRWEEQDLVDEIGEGYSNYKKQVPMIIPFIGKGKKR